MKEIKDIIKAHQEATRLDRQSALATVVHVEGSSYRRPGARMLVTDDGQLTGAISGGCLEGDALRKALLAISQQQNKLVTYDTTDEDDAKFGVQLGCNGIVHILFEPITPEHNPVALLQQLTERRQDAVLVTAFSLRLQEQLGTITLFRNNDEDKQPNTITTVVEADAKAALSNRTSSINTHKIDGKEVSVFAEFIPPPIAVVIAGAGNDVQPLVQMTAILGWQTTVVDGRRTHATQQRFPQAHNVVVAKPEEVLQQVQADAQTVFVLMTHNYNYDLALLKELLRVECGYIGVLGPRKKMQRMFDDLAEAGVVVTAEQQAWIHAPVGLDIGAETAEEIAVSIVAEIKAALANCSGGLLKNKQTAIHQRVDKTVPIND